jgi:hypothetical protein
MGVQVASPRAVPASQRRLGGRVQLASTRDDVEAVLPADQRVRARQGLRMRGERLRPEEIVPTPHGLATSPARTAFDLARRGRPDRALAWVDAVLRETAIGAPDIQEVIRCHPRVRGLRQAERVVAVADPRAESPRESMLRWDLLDAGLPPPTPQFVVCDGLGWFVARLDLAWEAVKVGAEYVRAMDGLGQWSGVFNAGPYVVDISTPRLTLLRIRPAAPTRYTVQLGAVDAGAGVAAINVYWNHSRTVVNGVRQVTAGSGTIVSPALSRGSWYAHVRVADQAGHWSGWTNAGPYTSPLPFVRGAVTQGARCPAAQRGYFGFTRSRVLERCLRTPTSAVLRWRPH